MYIPKQNAMTDEAEILSFMQHYSFATIVTVQNNLPTATHLPFSVSKREDKIVLTAHFAKANPQWRELTGNKVLVIFSEPHAYISPKHYDKELSVPTWNYLAVHAYGQGKLILNEEEAFKTLEDMINNFEADYLAQWNRLPNEFKLKMLNGIVVFEIEVSELQASKKLSQNKSEAERRRISDVLAASSSDVEKQIGSYMKLELPQDA